jgi:hydrogenase/urease accessory protein HupE
VRNVSALLVTIACALPGPAQAHLVNTGLGPFYDGITHFLVSPETLLAVLALGLLAGVNGPGCGRAALFGGLVAWCVGSLGGLVFRWSPPFIVCLLVPLLLGVIVAVQSRVPRGVIVLLALLTGSLTGLASGAALGGAQQGVLSVGGTVIPLFVLLSMVTGIAVGARKEWAQTVVRVAGSWIAAMSLLMIGWWWRTGAGG